MGKKRKHDLTEEEIRKKIKKLTEKLSKTTTTAAAAPAAAAPAAAAPAAAATAAKAIVEECIPPEQTLINSPLDPPYNWTPYCESLFDSMPYEYEPSLPHATSQQYEVSPQPPVSPPSPPVQTQALPLSPQPGPSTEKEAATEELELGDEILELLGDAPKEATPLGSAIHNDVASRWQNILAKGLPKDVRESLSKAYLVPSNCDLLLTPTLNLEVKAALPDHMVKRDSSLAYKQKQLGIALSALANVTQMVLSDEPSKQKILKPLSDACRILCDSHHADTRTRRSFIISSINAKLKEALIESSRDKLLFGENISEKLKLAKAIQQSGDALKNAPKPRFQRTIAASTSANRGRSNFLPQHRKVVYKENEGRRAPYPQSSYPPPYPGQRQPPSSSNARRPPERPPPKSQPPRRR